MTFAAHLRTRFLIPCVFFMVGIACASTAKADIVFSEDFSLLTGTEVNLEPAFRNSTERGDGVFLVDANIPNWQKEGLGDQVIGFNRSGNLAVVLNEGGGGPNGIVRSISGLTVGQAYRLQFEYWGDNVTGPYDFFYRIDEAQSYVQADSVGLNLGTFNTEEFFFTASTSETTLSFNQRGLGLPSPVLDNITITSVPEPNTVLFPALSAALIIFPNRRRSR